MKPHELMNELQYGESIEVECKKRQILYQNLYGKHILLLLIQMAEQYI